MSSRNLEIYWLGQVPYEQTWLAMKDVVARRLAQESSDEPDQLWLLHHDPVYTLGTRGVRAGLIGALEAPVVQSDRGGDVTFHGPGQLVGYPLLQLDRLGLTGASFVHTLEALLVAELSSWGIHRAEADPDKPGVYIDGRKIASLGLRCKRRGQRQLSYHGFALNVAMDLSPFLQINPCGYAGQPMTQLTSVLSEESHQAVGPQPVSVQIVAERLAKRFYTWHEGVLSQVAH